MINKRIVSMALLSMAVSVAMHAYAEEGDAAASTPVDATNTLPNAKPGECYAKVIVPAKYENQPEEVVVTPEQETVTIIPATFDVEEQEIEVKPAYTVLKVIPAKFRTEEEKVEIEAARTEWVTSLRRNPQPASPALLVAAKTSGIDIDNAEPGQCFREYYQPAKFEQKEKQVEVKEAFENIVVKPAELEDSEETVTVKESYTVKKLIPAVYDKEQIKVEIEPAKAVWKKGSGLIERIDNTTGEIMCLVNVPAKYETLMKTVLKSKAEIEESEVPAETSAVAVKKLVTDATQETEEVPAEYTTVNVREKVSDAEFSWRAATEEGDGKYTGLQICLNEILASFQTVKKQVLDAPVSVEEEKKPAETKTVRVQKVATAAEVSRETIEPVKKTVEKRAKVSDERLEWRRVLCQTNMTPEINAKIQKALKEAGFYNGPIDGNIGRGTMNAVNEYQQSHDLPRGGLTYDVLDKLGVM